MNSTPRGVYLDNAIFDDETCNLGNLDEPCDTLSILNKLKLKNVNRLVIGHDSKYDSKSLVKDKTCFKNPKNPRCIDLFITNSIGSFQKTTAVASGFSDFHKMIMTVLKATFQKSL